MLVSCVMPTFNRVPNHIHLLEEAVESFLRQDYTEKELIIVNDQPQQTLRVEGAPANVLVVNLPRRCRTLGEKLNLGFAMASGALLMRMDDDDVFLPWRISLSVQALGVHDYVKPRHLWYMPPRQLLYRPSGFSTGLFTRIGFDRVGGFAHMDSGEDQKFEEAFGSSTGTSKKLFAVTPEETFYIYRWGNGSPHISGYGNRDGYAEIGRMPAASGEFVIRPRWGTDYAALAAAGARAKGEYKW
mgnify:CR=1 FL=1